MHHVASMPAGLNGERAALLVCIPALSVVWQANLTYNFRLFHQLQKHPTESFAILIGNARFLKGQAFPLRTPDWQPFAQDTCLFSLGDRLHGSHEAMQGKLLAWLRLYGRRARSLP